MIRVRRRAVTGLKSVVRRLADEHVYTVRRGVARGLLRRGGLGFIPQPGRTKEERFLRSLDLRGGTVYDIGAHEGAVSMFFARKVGEDGRVISFEPNPRSVRRLQENLRLNRIANVDVVETALGSAQATGVLNVPAWEPGRGSLVRRRSPTEGRHAPGEQEATVPIDTLDRVVAERHLPPPTFVKIDVEGFEGEVLHGMEETLDQHRPRLMIELHGVGREAKRAGAMGVVDLLTRHRYAIRHVESGGPVESGDPPIEGHLDALPIEGR